MKKESNNQSSVLPCNPETQKQDNPNESPFIAIREIIETLAVALFLALLFKTFEAEAFVIPTGSMAPTLKGRHKDVFCEQCRYPFQVSASEEINNTTNRATTSKVVAGTCPQCGFTQFFGLDSPSFTGDRIFVNKSTFDFRDLKRWDVSVFRAPAEPRINFIKRVVGLPNEQIRIQYGDLFIKKREEQGENNVSDFEIARKPLKYLLQMLQPVYDADYPLPQVEQLLWPSRWFDETNQIQSDRLAWKTRNNGTEFHFNKNDVNDIIEIESCCPLKLQNDNLSKRNDLPSTDQQRTQEDKIYWLRYRHIVPSSTDWFSLAENRIPREIERTGIIKNNPQLITDATAYNTGISKDDNNRERDEFSLFVKNNNDKNIESQENSYQCYKLPTSLGGNWIGDLAVSCDMTISCAETKDCFLVFELVKGGQNFQCLIYPTLDLIRLAIPGFSEFGKKAKADFHFETDQKYRIMFMNIDEQLRLVINDEEIAFENEGKYDDLCRPLPNGKPNLISRNRDPNELDLTPVSIGIREMNADIAHLKILRDIYYIASGPHTEPETPFVSVKDSNLRLLYDFQRGFSDRLTSRPIGSLQEEVFARFLADPTAWKGYGNTRSVLINLDQGQYLALGDNSSASQDSREWGCVDEKYLIGKAFFVYWPHGKLIPGTRLPFIPSFAKMRHID
ncbi:MAG: S26 family signal peptidase [Planctomycetia bacterium]|nr:S26 family signal peptidase [Planctomycetia bacterium]